MTLVKSTIVITPSVFYFGTPVVLISTTMPDGRTNLTPISSAWALGDRYVLGMVTWNQGTRNALRTGQLVINLPDVSLVDAIERMAPTTGAAPIPSIKRDRYRHERDKWRLADLTPAPSELVLPERVAECPVQLEAEVAGSMPITAEAIALSARVVRAHAHDAVVVPSTSYIDLDRWRPLYYTFRHYYAQGSRVGVNFKAEQ